MWIIDKLLQSTVGRMQLQMQTQMQSALTNLYNQNVFKFINDGQPFVNTEDFDFIDGGYKTVGAVFECTDIIIKKVIACPRIVYKVKDQKEYKKFLNYSKSPNTLDKMLVAKAKALEEVHIPAIEKLLNQPNPRQNGDEMLEMLTGLYLLRGNSFLYGNGSDKNIKAHKWSELFAMPTQMRIISGGMLAPIKEYLYSWNIDTPFPADQIKHFKTFNPSYGLNSSNGENMYGMPPLRAYLYSLDIIKNADKQSDKQIKNGGKLGFISPKNKEDQLETEQKADLKNSLTRAFSDDSELARIIPGSIPLDWTEIGLSSQDLELLKTSDAKADDIYRCFHIPLQFRNQDTATYNNLPVANRQMVYNAVAPITRRIDQGLTEFICTPYMKSDGVQYVIHLDFTSLPELNDDMKAVAEWLDKCWDLTPNEKREIKGWGRSAQAGMDEIWVDKKMVRMSDVLAGKIDQSSSATPPTDGSNTAVPAKSETPWLIEE